ncbi:MAG: undecaprenyl-diphosphate phosphatase [Microthrixaceae bacterium]|nr:undecaprenyl-diphosphate phosphatase [Microthrixaceae bacterium]
MRFARLAAVVLLALIGTVVVAPLVAGAAPTPTEPRPDAVPLSTVDAVILGAVEGITEYLPVSSTGHLLVTERLLDIGTGDDKAATDSYTVVIQLGAIVAVLGIFWQRFMSMAGGLVGRDEDGRNSLIAVVVAFIPAGIIGKLFGDSVKEHLLSPTPVAITWIVGGLIILLFVAQQSRLTTRIESVSEIGVRNAAIIGVAQTLALIPGTSRSFVTILAAMLLGVNMATAVEFSFLLGFVTLSAATALELVQNGDTLVDTFGVVSPLVGIAVAAVTAFLSVKFMIDWLNKRGLAVFGWYRLAVGAAAVVLIATDRI